MGVYIVLMRQSDLVSEILKWETMQEKKPDFLSSAPSLSRKLAAELLGTFVFVIVGAGSALGAASLSSPTRGRSC